MSDIHPHSRPDLDLLPCDTEPQHGPSFYLTLKPRSLVQAVRDVSRHRDLEPWVWELLAPKRDNLISLASERAIRSRRKG